MKLFGRVALAICLLTLPGLPAVAQEDGERKNFIRRYLEGMLGEGQDPAAPKLINYPTVAYAPETSWEIGVSSLYVYSANRDLSNRLSELKAFTFYTLESQYGVWLDHAVYTDRNLWFIYGRARYQSFPLFYYGIGREAPSQVQSVIDGEYVLLRERILRETLPSLYVGLELDYQGLNGIEYVNSVNGFKRPDTGPAGSQNLGVGLGILHNDIHNAMNPREGLYAEWAFLRYGLGGGSEFDFTTLILDHRVYRPLSENTVLAAQLYGQFTLGEAPFNMLALMGGESLMRGYYLGRFRDRNLVAAQIEYRILPFSFSQRIGASVFLATGQVYGDGRDLALNQFLPTGGAGLRFLIFPEKDIYTRVNAAFTREKPGVYFVIGEAF